MTDDDKPKGGEDVERVVVMRILSGLIEANPRADLQKLFELFYAEIKGNEELTDAVVHEAFAAMLSKLRPKH